MLLNTFWSTAFGYYTKLKKILESSLKEGVLPISQTAYLIILHMHVLVYRLAMCFLNRIIWGHCVKTTLWDPTLEDSSLVHLMKRLKKKKMAKSSLNDSDDQSGLGNTAHISGNIK